MTADNQGEAARIALLNEELRLANSYSRLPILLEMARYLEDDKWLQLLGKEWESCDNIGHHIDGLMRSPLAHAERPIRSMMTSSEMVKLTCLPDTVTIYRGCYAINKWGLSWSLSQTIAESFPFLNRYFRGDRPLLVTAQVRRQDIIAVKLDRDESEVIAYRPKHISTRRIRSSKTAA